MKRLLHAADRSIAQMDWKDMALVKLCLCAMGVLLGLAVPRRARKPAALCAGAVFAATYVPLMKKFIPALAEAVRGEEKDLCG